jgi:3-methyl-2-oxobutanoate hydroxymethyltransferase
VAEERKKLTIPALREAKKSGRKIAMTSIPDYPSAPWAERAGIDICAIGDSLGMVSYGFANTLPVTVDNDDRALRGGGAGRPQHVALGRDALWQLSQSGYRGWQRVALHERRKRRLRQDAGWARQVSEIIKAIADAGVPVMSHVGMCPHFVHQYAGFKLQGKTADEALKIIDDGIAIQEAGAVGFEIEAVPAPVARAVDAAVEIFTFGIGAGPASCGQLLLAFDLLGVFDQFKPKFTKRYANISQVAVDALTQYAAEVRNGQFPDAERSYSMKPEEVEKLAKALGKKLQ